jgi:hypothetical protein
MCIEQEFDTVKLRRIIMQIYCTKINADIQADERVTPLSASPRLIGLLCVRVARRLALAG